MGKKRGIKSAGRPRAFFAKEKRDEFLKALKSGVPAEKACRYADISPRTYYRLMERHEKRQLACEEKSLADHGTEEYWMEYVEEGDREEAVFCQAIKKADGEFHVRCAMAMEKPPKGTSWQAFATKLERRDPENWGRKDRTMLSNDPDNPFEARVTVYLPDNKRGPDKDESDDKPNPAGKK